MHTIILDKILVPYIGEERTLRIYLPPNYNESSHFPVIYMHDAQNLYNIETSSYGAIWDIHDHMNRYYEEHQQGVIVVGIDNHEGPHNRFNEYSPWVNTEYKHMPSKPEVTKDVGGLGKAYVDFIVHQLKPYIDNQFKTQPERHATGIIGSSMGGLISLYAITAYPDIFSKVGAFSTASWFAEDPLLACIESFQQTYPVTWYLDIGTLESDDADLNTAYLNGSKKIHQALIQKNETDVLFVIDEGGIHNEKDWSKRFYKCLEFLFKK